ncbi:hypothetical protein KXD97_10945 [Mycobacterium sp. SMC-8]|uniref:hypothetical protein n=1 Tax=Mycobacterium sp. SMC-8 TaxID=2857060 RepID=UPI0021B3BFCA|nr:hypothetical protein [Mycobacterium sp. SMC-8]UXA14247.1 hypothetical protein KXD97_10945 [Mycobacterium sp. SMC-8]
MTIDTTAMRALPCLFDAGLPMLAYHHVEDPLEAHRLIAPARACGPIAIGTHGPELLSYHLARGVLRDPRFRVPRGVFLSSQGIQSGGLAGVLGLDRRHLPGIALDSR